MFCNDFINFYKALLLYRDNFCHILDFPLNIWEKSKSEKIHPPYFVNLCVFVIESTFSTEFDLWFLQDVSFNMKKKYNKRWKKSTKENSLKKFLHGFCKRAVFVDSSATFFSRSIKALGEFLQINFWYFGIEDYEIWSGIEEFSLWNKKKFKTRLTLSLNKLLKLKIFITR